MIKLIVFDFDGTLVDTKKFLFGIIEEKLGKIGLRLTKAFIEHFGDNQLKKSLDTILLDKKILPIILEEIHLNFINSACRITANKNLKELKEIKKKKIILSNSIIAFIKPILKNLDADFFDEIHGADTIVDKLNEFKIILRKDDLKPEEVVYVGDRPVDIKLAKAIGCFSVAISNKVSWSPKRELTKENPDFVIRDLGELKSIISQLDSPYQDNSRHALPGR